MLRRSSPNARRRGRSSKLVWRQSVRWALLALIAIAWTLASERGAHRTARAPSSARPLAQPDSADEGDGVELAVNRARERVEQESRAEASAALLQTSAADVGSPGDPPLATDSGDRVSVAVVDATGATVAGAWVEVRERLGGDETLLRRQTGPLGELQVVVKGASANFVAWSDTYVSAIERVALPTATPVVLTLTSGVELRGRVVASDTGRSVEAARLALWTHAETDVVETDANGEFVHPRIPRGGPSQQLRVSAPGFAPLVQYLRVGEDGSWEFVGADGLASISGVAPQTEVAIGLRREKRIAGRVVDSLGRPIAGADVVALGHVLTLPGVATRDRGTATSDANGDFVIAGIHPDIRHHLRVSAKHFARGFAESPPGVATELGSIKMTPEAFFVGLVTDGNGRPVRGAQVTVWPTGEHPSGWTSIEKSGWRQLQRRSVDTDEEGRFELDGLAAAAHTLRVRRGGSTLASETAIAVEDPFHSTVELVVDGSWSTLVGEVRYTDGADAAGANVVVRRRGRELARVKTDGAGRFYVTGLNPEDRYEIDALGALGERAGVRDFGTEGAAMLFLERKQTLAGR